MYADELARSEHRSVLETLNMHQHPCSIYADNEQLKKQFVPYLRAGLSLGQKCVYLVDEHDESFVINAMTEDGYDLEQYIATGQFEIINSRNAHLQGGCFDEERMIFYWIDAIKAAKEGGFEGLRAAVEMTWALSGKPGCDNLTRYESSLTRLLQATEGAVICMYSLARFSPEKIKAIIQAHPIVVTNEGVSENPDRPEVEASLECGTNPAVQIILHKLESINEWDDVTRERQRQLHSDAAFRLLVETVKDYAIFMLDPYGHIVSWNEGAHRINGYAEDEIVGKHFSIFYNEEAKTARHPEKELEIAREKGRYEEEGWRIRKDGSVFWASVVITALFRDGVHVGFAKVTRDLTERKNAEKAREKAHRRIEKLNDELQHLAYMVTHELQEPLLAITSYSKLLASRYEGRLGQDADEFLKKIQSGAKKTARLIDDLWTYARVSKPGSLQTEVHSGHVLRDAKDDLQSLITARQVEITHSAYEEFPELEGNREQLLFVFKELITNAIKHNKGGIMVPAIRITAVRERNGWTFCFKDNGPGIDKFFAQEVFAVYHRLDGKPDETGTGMGLPICKRIIEDQHDGKLGFESIEGKGANFFFWLPDHSRT